MYDEFSHLLGNIKKTEYNMLLYKTISNFLQFYI